MGWLSNADYALLAQAAAEGGAATSQFLTLFDWPSHFEGYAGRVIVLMKIGRKGIARRLPVPWKSPRGWKLLQGTNVEVQYRARFDGLYRYRSFRVRGNTSCVLMHVLADLSGETSAEASLPVKSENADSSETLFDVGYCGNTPVDDTETCNVSPNLAVANLNLQVCFDNSSSNLVADSSTTSGLPYQSYLGEHLDLLITPAMHNQQHLRNGKHRPHAINLPPSNNDGQFSFAGSVAAGAGALMQHQHGLEVSPTTSFLTWAASGSLAADNGQLASHYIGQIPDAAAATSCQASLDAPLSPATQQHSMTIDSPSVFERSVLFPMNDSPCAADSFFSWTGAVKREDSRGDFDHIMHQ